MTTQHERQAWEYVGDQIDRLSKKSGWTAPQVWIPLVLQAVMGLLAVAVMWARIDTLREEMKEQKVAVSAARSECRIETGKVRDELHSHQLGGDGLHPWRRSGRGGQP